MADRYDVVIVGAGHAAAHAATALRDNGFTGSVLVVGEAAALPYDSAPRLRSYKLGSVTIERILLGDAAYWQEHKIDILPGTTVIALDLGASIMRLSDGRDISFGRCILASDGAARTPSSPGAGRRDAEYRR